MTCISGLVFKDEVWIGGDSAGVAGTDIAIRADRKVFFNGPFLFGFAGSFRAAQLMRYAFEPPRHRSWETVDKFMVTTFVDAMRRTLCRGGSAQTHEGEDAYNGACLVGYRGRLFSVQSDFQVAEQVDGFDSVGSGSSYAIGVLFANKDLAPHDRILQSLQAAERFGAEVAAPFHIEVQRVA